MAKTRLIGLLILLGFFWKTGFGQDDPRNEGQYMDYSTVQMPESPTASAFNIVGDIQVNPAKGIPSISIPIYTYEIDGVKVPISLSYDASGIKVSQMATSVGLGWSLNAGGQISRTVRARPDEENYNGWFEDGYLRPDYYLNKDADDLLWQQEMKGSYLAQYTNGLVKNRDHNPDLYSYSFLGHSGTYIHDTDEYIIKEKNDGVFIPPFANIEDDLEAYDLVGNHYFFNYADIEYSKNKNKFNSGSPELPLAHSEWDLVNGHPITTAWKLSQIMTKNGKEIAFDYESEYMEYTIDTESLSVTLGHSCKQGGGTVLSTSATDVEHKFTTQLLTKISSPDSSTKVEFEYGEDSGLPDGVWKKKLVKIIISNNLTQDKRVFNFHYSRFPVPGDPRLKLDSIQEMGYKNGITTSKPAYKFQYQSGNLPPKDSRGQDFYGYYNLADSNDGLLPDIFIIPEDYGFRQYYNRFSGDRSLNINGLKRGVLTQITYPTGGRTLFEYEPNVDDLNSLSGYRGGLRVREVKNQNEYNVDFNRKTYEYANLKGIDLESQVYQWFSKPEGGTRSYSTHPIRLPGDISGYRTGYFYGQVSVISHNDIASENFKTEFNYSQNDFNFQGYDYVLASEIHYLGTSSNRVKSTEYTNELISVSGDLRNFQWYIVGDMACYQPNNNNNAIGYTTDPRRVEFSGDYAYLPTQIKTTDFLKQGSVTKEVISTKTIAYDPETLLKTQEVTDTGDEIITTNYTYPSTANGFSTDFPKGLLLKKEVSSNKTPSPKIFGQAMEYDNIGNVIKTYQYNKGEMNNNSPLIYIPGDYEEMSTITYANGNPVQVLLTNGEEISFIWGYNNQHPVAKVEGVPYGALVNDGHVAAMQSATNPYDENSFTNAANAIRSGYDHAMVTAYTHKPLAGVGTISDPKGDRVTYYYDSFGRLEMVKDKDEKILSENEYHYRPQ